VISPNPPICTRAKIMHLPNVVNELRGIVNKPVTQVAEVAVNKRSIKDIGVVRQAGCAKRSAPTKMVQKTEERIVRPGESGRVF